MRCKFLLLFLFMISNGFAQEDLRITYLGNMGVLLGGDKEGVLIDGLHTFYKPQYTYPSEFIIKKVLDNAPGFKTSKVLYTHFHRDHINGSLNCQYLAKNPYSLLVGPKQLKTVFEKEESCKKVRDQIKLYGQVSEKVAKGNDISIEPIPMKHVNVKRHASVENLAFLITINKLKVLHVGDAALESFMNSSSLKNKKVTVGIFPIWFLLSSESFFQVTDVLEMQYILITHMAPDMDIRPFKKEADRHGKQIFFLTKIGEKVRIQ